MEPSEATTDIGSLHDRALYCKELASIPQADDGVDSPCHLMRLPPEIRREIFTYLIPEEPVESQLTFTGEYSTKGRLRKKYPISLSGLFLSFNRAIYEEVKDTFYTITDFVIRVDRDVVLLCGMVIVGSFYEDDFHYWKLDQRLIDRFVRNFAWGAVRNYSVVIVVGRGEEIQPGMRSMVRYNPEVELYRLHDYVSEVVSGILAKADHLRNLQVSVDIKVKDLLTEDPFCNIKLLIKPLQNLRGILKPSFVGVFEWVSIPERGTTRVPLLVPHLPELTKEWRLCVATEGSTKMLPVSLLTKLFDEFKALYNKLGGLVHESGPRDVLHQARVAHEQDDVVRLRKLFPQLRDIWQRYVEAQESSKRSVETLLQRATEADSYAETFGPLWS